MLADTATGKKSLKNCENTIINAVSKILDWKLCELGLNVTGIFFFLFSIASGKHFTEQILCSVALYWFSYYYFYCYTGGAVKCKDLEKSSHDKIDEYHEQFLA